MNKVEPQDVKRCCAAFYGSDLAGALLGESFHPGGTALTERMGRMIRLTRGSRVLDVAAGRGASALHLAQAFGCEVVGIDLSEDNVRHATEQAARARVSERVSFRIGDAERLPFDAGSFDAVLCECSFCTLPSKPLAAEEFGRVLARRGQLAFSDLTKTAEPLPELEGLLAWVACIGDAQPVESYVATLEGANFAIERIEDHRRALEEMVRQTQGRLLEIEIAAALSRSDFAGVDFSEPKRLIRTALEAIGQGKLGYAAIAASRRD